MSWTALRHTAARQHGVVSRACARGAGLPAATLVSRARREAWAELAPGCWLLPGAPESLHARVQAALLAYPSSVATGWTAAALLRRAVTRVDGLEVVTTTRVLRELAGVADDAALTDLAIDIRLHRRAAIAEAAALLQRDARFRGRARLRRIVALLADDGSDSGFEHRVVARLTTAGLAPDGQQGRVETRDGVRRLGGAAVDLGDVPPRVGRLHRPPDRRPRSPRRKRAS
ncbi:MAG: hypothetical protein KG028_15445 [Actinobacteria bacterium]|jgi:hypothetical protein|nr:hypothetical protein [Actinomycetota bacterium]